MSLRQPTSTLDRYEPRIPRELPLDALPKNAVLPAQLTRARLAGVHVGRWKYQLNALFYGGSGTKASPAALKPHRLTILIGLRL